MSKIITIQAFNGSKLELTRTEVKQFRLWMQSKLFTDEKSFFDRKQLKNISNFLEDTQRDYDDQIE